MRFVFAALAITLALLAFLPWASWLGTGRPGEIEALIGTMAGWALWLAVAVPVAVLLTARWGGAIDGAFERVRGQLVQRSSWGYALALAVVLLVIGALLSKMLFAYNPHLVDTIAQLFQARIFTSGQLTAPAPHELEFFAASHLVEHEGRWFSQYPPGHPALLALGLIAGTPWLVNPLFTAATLLVVFAIARRLLGEGSAKLAVALYLISPFALLMGASFMNHVTTGLFLALALYAALRAGEADRRSAWVLVLGVALGLAASIRPLESAAWAAVLGAWLWARKGWRPAFLAGGVCLASLAPLLAYNALTTGHPLRFGYTLLWGAGHGLGFHTDPWGELFTPLTSFASTALDFARLNVFLFKWPFPSLAFLLVALALAGFDRRLRGNAALLAALVLAAPAAYFFYWHRDNYLGPRFLYASLIPVLLLTVVGISELDRRIGRWRPALRMLLLAGVIHALVISLPDALGVVSGTEPEMKLHPEAQADSLGVDEAVVFVKVSWGSRLVARLWGWRVPASEAERSFRLIDGCRLQDALDAADSLAMAGRDSTEVRSGLRARLAHLRDAGVPVARGLLPDASVRVDTTQALPRRCYSQVQQDQAGFTVYGPLVWRNDPRLRSGVIYARYFEPERNLRLLAKFPGRDSYIYAPLSSERTAKPVLRRFAWGRNGAAANDTTGRSVRVGE